MMLSFSVPPGYRREAPIKRPKLDGFAEIIDAWLAEDQGRNRKQRHTAKRVLERLRPSHRYFVSTAGQWMSMASPAGTRL